MTSPKSEKPALNSLDDLIAAFDKSESPSEAARAEFKAAINKTIMEEVLTAVDYIRDLPDMQEEIPYTRSKSSARHARNKLRTERLIPAIEVVRQQLIKKYGGGHE